MLPLIDPNIQAIIHLALLVVSTLLLLGLVVRGWNGQITSVDLDRLKKKNAKLKSRLQWYRGAFGQAVSELQASEAGVKELEADVEELEVDLEAVERTNTAALARVDGYIAQITALESERDTLTGQLAKLRSPHGMAWQRRPSFFPTVVTLCGSTRFKDIYIKATRDETLAGRIVISVGLFGREEGLEQDGPIKAKLDELHLRKIDICDEILVLNVDGYIGSSTAAEITYAMKHGKTIRFLNEDLGRAWLGRLQTKGEDAVQATPTIAERLVSPNGV